MIGIKIVPKLVGEEVALSHQIRRVDTQPAHLTDTSSIPLTTNSIEKSATDSAIASCIVVVTVKDMKHGAILLGRIFSRQSEHIVDGVQDVVISRAHFSRRRKSSITVGIIFWIGSNIVSLEREVYAIIAAEDFLYSGENFLNCRCRLVAIFHLAKVTFGVCIRHKIAIGGNKDGSFGNHITVRVGRRNLQKIPMVAS